MYWREIKTQAHPRDLSGIKSRQLSPALSPISPALVGGGGGGNKNDWCIIRAR